METQTPNTPASPTPTPNDLKEKIVQALKTCYDPEIPVASTSRPHLDLKVDDSGVVNIR
jgi:hypothetical protein